MKTTLLLCAALLLSACGPLPMPKYGIDQCKRAALFQACLAAVPKGPTHVGTSNDWDEVVEACQSSARQMSVLSDGSLIKPECFAQ